MTCTKRVLRVNMSIGALCLWLVVVCVSTRGVNGRARLQTPVQAKVVAQAAAAARVASADAVPEMEALFADDRTYRYLKQLDDGSRLYVRSPEDLVQLFWGELGSAELVHSFGEGVSNEANCGFDITVAQGMRMETFPNQWVVQVEGLTPVDPVNNQFTEWSETNIFHFPPFANVSQPDIRTAVSRPFYSAVNMYRGSGGNPQCGPISAVLSRTYVGEEVLCAAVDTGFYVGACTHGSDVGEMGSTKMARCNAWPAPHTLGVPGHVAHLLSPYLHYYNETQGEVGASDYPYYNLARLLIRLLSRVTYASAAPSLAGTPSMVASLAGLSHVGATIIEESAATNDAGEAALRLNFVENSLGYFEYNPAVSIPFHGGVKMMVGMYELLWGTRLGDELRAWCQQRGWPLAWAYNPAMSFWRCGPAGNAPQCTFPPSLSAGIDTANVRILDPVVLARSSSGHNVTVSARTEEQFEEAWRSVNVTSLPHDAIEREWSALSGAFFADFAVEPVYYLACASEQCVGVRVSDGVCICPTNS